ncbi:MAG: hypothetical protein RUDDFDWM_001402 [Candidatus Fervidibacterota bacterium]
MDVKEALDKAEQFLKAAKVTLTAEMADTCVIACYYAVFWSAIAMLHYVGKGSMSLMRRKSRAKLRKLLDEMCQFIKELEPKAQILRVIPHQLYEDDDAWIEVLLPYREWNKKAERISDAVYKRVWEIEMEHG